MTKKTEKKEPEKNTYRQRLKDTMAELHDGIHELPGRKLL